jgi:hypothetical protein
MLTTRCLAVAAAPASALRYTWPGARQRQMKSERPGAACHSPTPAPPREVTTRLSRDDESRTGSIVKHHVSDLCSDGSHRRRRDNSFAEDRARCPWGLLALRAWTWSYGCHDSRVVVPSLQPRRRPDETTVTWAGLQTRLSPPPPKLLTGTRQPKPSLSSSRKGAPGHGPWQR